MRRLIYLSPVRWADFAQRPHKFVEWHHARHGSEILWVEPYPTRLPQLNDLRRLAGGVAPPGQCIPKWLQLERTPSLPIEPLPGGTNLNAILWRTLIERLAAFARDAECELVLGKPSRLALEILAAVRFGRTVYDAMDDFPAFHAGLSARTVAATERRIAALVDLVQVSSSVLHDKFRACAAAVRVVHNACDPTTLPDSCTRESPASPKLVGYVGTMASWFDWELVFALAREHPALQFRLIGPRHSTVPAGLPCNVELRPPCVHSDAMREMARFDVGLIPFRHNQLTNAVDPVKYYEYRALGVPVLATCFGEMPQHARTDPGVFMVTDDTCASNRLNAALSFRTDANWIAQFRTENSWKARFAEAECGTINSPRCAGGG